MSIHHKTQIQSFWKQYRNVDKILEQLPDLKKNQVTKFLSKDILAEIKHLFQSTRKIKTISDTIGINRKTVYAYIDRYNIEIPTINEKSVVLDYMQGISVRNLKTKYHTDSLITPILKKFDVNVLVPEERTKLIRHINGAYDTEISSYFREVIIGSLLGDLFIGANDFRQKNHGKYNVPFQLYKEEIKFLRALIDLKLTDLDEIQFLKLVQRYNKAAEAIIHASTAFMNFHKAVEEEPWLYVLASLMSDEGFIPSHNLTTDEDGKLTSYLNTQMSVVLYPFIVKWYHEKKPGDDKIIKRIPSDLIITPNILLHWYIGDGSIDERRIILHTLGFSLEENQKLANYLERDVNLKAVVRKTTKILDKWKKYRDYYYLDLIGLDNKAKFFDFLDKSNPFVLQKAKEIFPWKFSRHLKKKDHLENLALLNEQ